MRAGISILRTRIRTPERFRKKLLPGVSAALEQWATVVIGVS
jgi:hypothetical protein